MTTTSPSPGERHRELDRGAAVGLDADVPAADPGDDLGDDRVGVLRARVVGGDDDLVGQARGDLAHERALAAVAVAARAEDDDDAPAREVARGVAGRDSSASGLWA